MIDVLKIPIRPRLPKSHIIPNPIAAKIQNEVWGISFWSAENEKQIFRYCKFLIDFPDKLSFYTQNVISDSKQITSESSKFEAAVILWNLASIISSNIKMNVLYNDYTNNLIQNHFKTILSIFYSLATEILPSSSAISNSDLNIQSCLFYHAVYTSHFYEYMGIISKGVLKAKYLMTASHAMEKSVPIAIQIKNYSPQLISCILALKSYLVMAQEEASILEFGSAIYYSRKGLSYLNSQPKDFQHKCKDIQIKLEQFHTYARKENATFTLQPVQPKNEIGATDILDNFITNHICFEKYVNDYDNIIKNIIDKIEKGKKDNINAADSIMLLISILAECDNMRKQINGSLYHNGIPKQSILNTLSDAEVKMKGIYAFISVIQKDNPFLFSIDETHSKLDIILNDIKSNFLISMSILSEKDANDILNNYEKQIDHLIISQNFLKEISQYTEKCFEISESLSAVE